jgi:hypothetical protein
MSNRSRGEAPYAVAQRRKVGEKSSASFTTSAHRTFDSPYAVTGLSSDSSLTGASPAAP